MAGSPLSAPRELRARWYLQVEKYHKTIKEICVIFGMSAKTYHKWYKIDHGLSLKLKRPRKIHPHTKLIGNIRVVIVEAKLKYNYGPAKMSVWLKRNYHIYISHQSIYKFYKKKHLIRKPRKKLQWYMPLKEPYFASIPGENVQLDVKYVPGQEQTWEYQYRFIDSITNIQFSTNVLSKDALSTIFAFKKAQRHFPFTIAGIQTDNGGEFRGLFHAFLNRQNITHRFIPKRSAPWNGKVERANRSIDDEYYLNPGRPWKSLQEYTRWYNFERPHFGKNMNGLTPHQKWLNLANNQCYP